MDPEDRCSGGEDIIEVIPDIDPQRMISNLLGFRRHLKVSGCVLSNVAAELNIVPVGVRMLYDATVEQLQGITDHGMKYIRKRNPRRQFKRSLLRHGFFDFFLRRFRSQVSDRFPEIAQTITLGLLGNDEVNLAGVVLVGIIQGSPVLQLPHHGGI